MKRNLQMRFSSGRGIAWMLVAILVVCMLPAATQKAHAGSLPGARVETNDNGDVFLGGNYIEVGISKGGSFGTSTAPINSSFHPYSSSSGIGLRVDGDGWNVGEASKTGDFFLPGTKEERWMLGYTCNDRSYEYIVDDRCVLTTRSWNVAPYTTNTSDVANGILSATVHATTVEGVEIVITYSFGVDDLFFKTNVEVKNVGTNVITKLRFLRSFDPDMDAETTGYYNTYNKVACNPISTDGLTEGGENNFAMVVAKGRESKEGFFFIAFDERARSCILGALRPDNIYGDDFSGFPMWRDNTSVSTYAGEEDVEGTAGYTLADFGIALTFELGTLAAGTQDQLEYYSSLDPDVTNSLSVIKKAANGAVDYEQEVISGLESEASYTVSYTSESGETVTFTVTAGADGSIPLEGTGYKNGVATEYDLLGKQITLTPIVGEDEEAVGQNIEVAGRPDTPGDLESPETVTKPEDISALDVTTTSNSIEVVSPVSGQEYSIDGGATWLKYTGSETIKFTGLDDDTEFTLITRISSTTSTPASESSTGASIRTLNMLQNMTINSSGYSGKYDGNAHSITVSVTGLEAPEITYSTAVDGLYTTTKPEYTNVGTYVIYYRITKEDYYPAYGHQTVDIGKATPIVSANGAGIDFGETLADSAIEGTATYNGNIISGAFAWENEEITPSVADSETTAYEIVFTPADTVNYASVTVTDKITVSKATQTAPASITAGNETISKKADGKLQGLTDKMEYRLADGTYQAVPTGATSVSNLEAGIYSIRYKADANHYASEAFVVEIKAGRKLVVTIPTTQVGYTLTTDVTSAEWNEEVTLTFTVAAGYSKVSTSNVFVNGVAKTVSGTTCAFNITEDVTVTVVGIADVTAPLGSIAYEDYTWTDSDRENVTHVYNKDITIVVSANDSGSGLDTVEYLRSDVKLTLTALQSQTDWQTYTSEIVETAVDGTNCFYYARVTDNAGNVAYFSADEILFDTTKPQIDGIEDGGTYYVGESLAITDTNLASVTINGTPCLAPYILEGNTGELYEIVVTDDAGNVTTYNITMCEIADLFEDVEDTTIQNVTDDDLENLNRILDELQAIDVTDATASEIEELDERIGQCEELLGQLEVISAERTAIQELVDTYTESTLKSTDLEDLQELLERQKELLEGENLTEEQRTELEEQYDILEGWTQLIEDIGTEHEELLDTVEGYDAGTVTLDEKESLLDLQERFEELLATEHLTEEEIADLEASLEVVIGALGSIEAVETVNNYINSLPKVISGKDDELAIMIASEAYEKLSEYEKSLVDATALLNALAALEDSKQPKTQDSSTLYLWFCVMVVSGALVCKETISRRKKRMNY